MAETDMLAFREIEIFAGSAVKLLG